MPSPNRREVAVVLAVAVVPPVVVPRQGPLKGVPVRAHRPAQPKGVPARVPLVQLKEPEVPPQVRPRAPVV